MFTSVAHGYLHPRLATGGAGSTDPATIIEIFQKATLSHGTNPALFQKRGATVCTNIILILSIFRDWLLLSVKCGVGKNIMTIVFYSLKP